MLLAQFHYVAKVYIWREEDQVRFRAGALHGLAVEILNLISAEYLKYLIKAFNNLFGVVH